MIPDASGGGGVFPREDGVCFQPFLLAFVLVRPELRAAVVKEKKEKKKKKKKRKKNSWPSYWSGQSYVLQW